MLISASLFSCKTDRKEYIQKLVLYGISLLHIDYIEGVTSYNELTDLRQIEDKIFFDIHMICKNICEEDISLFNLLHAKYLCYQYETLEKVDFKKLNRFDGKKGLAFTMDTPTAIIESLITKVDFILIMCTIPGMSGQKFNYDNIARIKELKQKYPELEIHVDGGIEFEKSVIMSHLNVSLIVSGSFFANASGEQLAERICKLKYANRDTMAEEVMIPISVLTIVDIDDDLVNILYALNQDKLSTVIVKEKGKLVGIVTDGDVRRILLKEREKSFSLSAKDIVNRRPITVQYNDTLSKLLYDNFLYNRAISAIPCIKNSEIVGLIDVNHL